MKITSTQLPRALTGPVADPATCNMPLEVAQVFHDSIIPIFNDHNSRLQAINWVSGDSGHLTRNSVSMRDDALIELFINLPWDMQIQVSLYFSAPDLFRPYMDEIQLSTVGIMS